jgi:competence protein ComEC
MLLTRGNFETLLTGDAGLEVLEKLPLIDLAGLDVYKVSHHGSKYNNSFELINQLKPRYCIISVGKNNFGHPAQEVLADLKKSNCKVLRTDQDGTIVLY